MGEEEKKEYELGDDAIFVFEGPNGREEARWRNLWVFDLSTKNEERLTDEELIINRFDISPDGKHIVYSTQKGLYLKPIGDLNAKPIAGSNEITENPVFSPDGKSIVYGSPNDQKLKKISIDGRAPFPLCELEDIRGMSWLEDDYIVFGTIDGRIIRVSSKGGDPETLFEFGAWAARPMHQGRFPLVVTGSESQWLALW